ncbi:MAG: zinc-dependent metalloprotease [Chitinophagaceae bacterium]|nr:zinc-dependent metalloprotease [Chitinophagaceae bacterium]
MKLRLLLVLIAASCVFTGFSQVLYQEIPLEKRIKQSAFAVEGKVISKESFWDKNHKLIYTSNTIEVYKVFKGNISRNRINIITTGGQVGNRGLHVSDQADLGIEQTGVFLLNTYSRSENLPSQYSTDIFDLSLGQLAIVSYDIFTATAQDMFGQYGSIKNNLYPRIESASGTAYTTIEEKNFDVPPIMPDMPAITNFSPTTVRAGAILDPTNNVLTINGTDFGTATGLAAVLFDDPNDGTNGSFTVVPYNSLYIVSWSATQVVVKVPSRAGTGLVGIRDDLGAFSFAGTNLNVEFSVFDGTHPSVPPPSGGAYQLKLMDTDGLGGYTIRYSTNTAGSGTDFNASSEKAAFERALDTWKKTTGFNITVGATTTNQTVDYDGINTIMWDNTNTGNALLAYPTLGICYSWSSACTDGNWMLIDFDIVFFKDGLSTGGSVNFNAGPCAASGALGQIDFETVALHELGHAHTFGHIIDGFAASNPAKVMHFAASVGANRRSPDVSSYTAGLYALTASAQSYGTCTTLPPDPPVPTTEMTPLSTFVPSNDNCPASFPGTTTATGAHPITLFYSTSNKNVDPSSTQIVCSGSAGVYNTVHFPIRTDASGGDLGMTIANYTTIADYSSCGNTGVRMAVYQLSACPGGSSFPAPIYCNSFLANGAITSLTGLAANTNYLIVFDGVANSKVSFDFVLSGTALPVSLQGFDAQRTDKQKVKLSWVTASEVNVKEFEVQRSSDKINYTVAAVVASKSQGRITTTLQEYELTDVNPSRSNSYYRLKIIDIDGKSQFSEIRNVKGSGEQGRFRLRTISYTGLYQVFADDYTGSIQYEVYDSKGAMLQKNIVQNGQNIDIRALSKGNYFIRFSDAKGNLLDTHHVAVIQ